ncbi:LysR family transcriptional regulator [Rhodopseudomonas palustris]|uniref:Transcriptional regulator, LysR family n=1 Tax=Rhodopseudomonas palustris (strain BisB18) TaxID=316056 RepID=Q21B25_RHOPB
MDFKQMQYFLCLAQEGNVTRAARQLNIVQPALSMQIAKLEKSVGKQLFYRQAHGVALTAAGETLVKLAGSIMQNIDHAREEMARLDGTISGRVSIGMITSAAQSTLAASSAKIAARYPEIQLLVCEGYTEMLLDWVAAGQLDIAIVNMPPGKSTLTAHHILDEQMMLARRPGSALVLPAIVPYARLKDIDIVIPSRRHGLRRILDAAAAEADFSLKPRLEIDTLSAICEVVATTDLVTVLPGIALHAALAQGRLQAHRLKKPAISRAVVWTTHPRRIVSAAMTAVMEIISADLLAAAKQASRLTFTAPR